MKKLYKFTLKSYIGPFVLTFFIALFVLLMQFLWKYVDDFVGKGFEWYVIAELMFYASATFVPMALPLAVLLSSLMTFGNLGENYELVAVKSAGISLQKLMRPLIIFIIFVSAGAFYFSNYVLPKANLEFFTLLSDVRKKKPAVTIDEGVFNSDIGDFIIKVGKKHTDGVRIEDIYIYDHSKNDGNKSVTIANKGRMEMNDDKTYLVLTLFDGVNYDESTDKKNKKAYQPLQKTYFSKEVQRIDLSSFSFKKSDKSLRRNSYQMLNVNQLAVIEDSLAHDFDSTISDYVKNSIKDLRYFSKYYPRDYNKNDTIHEETKRPNAYYTAIEKDSSLILDPNLISNFDSINQIRIISSALSLTRNASYKSTNMSKRIKNKKTYISKYKVEWHKKFTLSIACIILFFIGAPLGAIIRKGGLGMPLVISIIMFVLYHIFTISGEKSVKSMVLEPWMGMWLASIIYLPVGIFITWKATTDAPLLDAEVWQKVLNKINVFKRRKL